MAMTWSEQLEKLGDFIIVMAKELKENMHKGGWDQCPSARLHAHLLEELQEFEDERILAGTSGFSAERLFSEAADVANVIMMVADLTVKEHEKAIVENESKTTD